jgi:hypothetical protein
MALKCRFCDYTPDSRQDPDLALRNHIRNKHPGRRSQMVQKAKKTRGFNEPASCDNSGYSEGPDWDSVNFGDTDTDSRGNAFVPVDKFFR